MVRVEFSFGLGYDRTGAAIHPDDAQSAITDIIRKASHRYGGCFFHQGRGGWDSGNGVIIETAGVLVVDIDGDKYRYLNDAMESFAEFIGVRLNQTAVHVVYISTKGQFDVPTSK